MKKYSPNYLPISHDEFNDIYEALKVLPKISKAKCKKCNQDFEYASILIYAKCPGCGEKYKMRSYGAYEEVEDLIVLVLDWLGSGKDKEKLLKAYKSMLDTGNFEVWTEYFEE